MHLLKRAAMGLLVMLPLAAGAAGLSRDDKLWLDDVVRSNTDCTPEVYCVCLIDEYAKVFSARDVALYNFHLTGTATSFGTRSYEIPNLLKKIEKASSSCAYLQPRAEEEDEYDW